MVSRILVSLGIFLFAASAFSYTGAGFNHWGTKGKIRVDVRNTKKKAEPTDKIILSINHKNPGKDKLVCDGLGQITVTDGRNEADVFSWFEKRVVYPNSGYNQRFVFTTDMFGMGYSPIKESQVIENSCLVVVEETPERPDPSKKCDPEWEDCDWTCQAHSQDPNKCANPNQDWNTNPHEWVSEW